MLYLGSIITEPRLVIFSIGFALGEYVLLEDYETESSFGHIFPRLRLRKILTSSAVKVRYYFFWRIFPKLRLEKTCPTRGSYGEFSHLIVSFGCNSGRYYKPYWICILPEPKEIIGELLFNVLSSKPVTMWNRCTVKEPRHLIDSWNVQLLNKTVQVVYIFLGSTLFVSNLTVNHYKPNSFVLLGIEHRKRTVLCFQCTIVWK